MASTNVLVAEQPAAAPPQMPAGSEASASSKEGGTPAPLLVVQEEKAPFIAPPAPIREEQVQNAVNFLSHPNVKGSPMKYRRSFLERKGLTADEIDEAFRRVPDPPTGDEGVDTSSTASTLPTSSTVHTLRVPAQVGSQLRAGQQAQQQATQQQYSLQPIGTAPAQLGSGQLYAPISAQLTPASSPATTHGMRWTQMILALGVLGAGGAGTALLTQNYIFPRLKQWLRKLALEEKDGIVPSTVHAGKKPAAGDHVSEASTIAADVIQKSESHVEDKVREQALVKAIEANAVELRATLSTLKEVVQAIKPLSESKDSDSRIAVSELRKELRNFASTISEFSGHTPTSSQHTGLQSELTEIKQMLREANQLPKQRTALESAALSANGIESNGGSQLVISPVSAVVSPPPKYSVPVQLGNALEGHVSSKSPAESGGFDQAPHSQSYLQVMEMVQKGEKPPGIRDIDDKPPDPTRPPSDPQLKPRPKPWERGSTPASSSGFPISPRDSTASFVSSTTQDGLSSSNGTNGSSQWWQKRGSPSQFPPNASPFAATHASAPQYTVASTRPPAPNHGVVIREVSDPDHAESSNAVSGSGERTSESAAGSNRGSIGEGSSASEGRSPWVPPPVPLPVLPEAAAAMRPRPPEWVEANSATVHEESSPAAELPAAMAAEGNSPENSEQAAPLDPEEGHEGGEDHGDGAAVAV